MLARGYTPPSLLSLRSTPCWHVAIWYAPDWLKNTARWWLFQLVIYWHDEKTTSIVKTTNGPDLLKRDQHTSTSSAIPQGLVWWLLHTMMRHDESIQVVFYSCVFQSKHRLVPLVGGLLRPHFPHDTTNDASFTTTRQPPPVCSREPLKGTCFAREIHRIIRHHGELAQQ